MRAFTSWKKFTWLGLDCFGSISTLGLFAVAVLMTYHQGTLGYPATSHISGLSPSEKYEAQDANTTVNSKSKGRQMVKKLNTMKEAITSLLSSFWPWFCRVRSIPLSRKEGGYTWSQGPIWTLMTKTERIRLKPIYRMNEMDGSWNNTGIEQTGFRPRINLGQYKHVV